MFSQRNKPGAGPTSIVSKDGQKQSLPDAFPSNLHIAIWGHGAGSAIALVILCWSIRRRCVQLRPLDKLDVEFGDEKADSRQDLGLGKMASWADRSSTTCLSHDKDQPDVNRRDRNVLK